MDVHTPYFLSRYPDRPSVHQFALEFLREWSDHLAGPPPDDLTDTFLRPDDTEARYKGMNTPAWERMMELHYHFRNDDVELDDPVSLLMNLYVKGVNWFDQNHLSKYVEFLENTDAGERTTTVLSGDHGEAPRVVNGEPTFYHRGKPFQDLIRVPGVIANAGLDDDAFEDWSLTGNVDFLPTLADLFDLDGPTESVSGLNLLESPPDSRTVYAELSDQISDKEFPRDVVLNWQAVIRSDGYKYYRQGMPVTDEDYELSLEQFIEVIVRKLAINVPRDEVLERWRKRAEEIPEEDVKEEFYEEFSGQYQPASPELYHWMKDHWEEDNLLRPGDEGEQDIANELDTRLCGRFRDPRGIAREETDAEISKQKQEEITDAMEGLGYL